MEKSIFTLLYLFKGDGYIIVVYVYINIYLYFDNKNITLYRVIDREVKVKIMNICCVKDLIFV